MAVAYDRPIHKTHCLLFSARARLYALLYIAWEVGFYWQGIGRIGQTW